MKSTVFELYQLEGFRPVRKNDKEWAGPCLSCGGKDRFLIFLDQGSDGLGRYLCRQCGKTGDAIQFLRDFKGMSFHEACRELGRDVPRRAGERKQPVTRSSHQAPKWEPKDNPAPEGPWQSKARKLVAWAAKELWKDQGVLTWLEQERGLTREIIQASSLGLIPDNIWRARQAWGLPQEMGNTGKPKKLWIPGPSLVIPVLDASGKVQRVKFRRFKPGPKEPKYLPLTSPTRSIAPLILLTSAKAWAVVESELDAILLAQEAGNLVSVAALGSASYRPDTTLLPLLEQAPFILVSLDHDEAGYKAAVRWWEERFPYNQLKLWPVPEGKDVCEAWQLGWDLREWVEAGLPPYLTPKEPTPETSPQEPEASLVKEPCFPQEDPTPPSEPGDSFNQAEQEGQLGSTESPMRMDAEGSATEPVSCGGKRISPTMAESYRAGRKWILPNLASLEAAGWSRADLFRIGRLRYPYGWGLAWSGKWTDPKVSAALGKSGQVEFSLQEHGRTITQTARPPRGRA